MSKHDKGIECPDNVQLKRSLRLKKAMVRPEHLMFFTDGGAMQTFISTLSLDDLIRAAFILWLALMAKPLISVKFIGVEVEKIADTIFGVAKNRTPCRALGTFVVAVIGLSVWASDYIEINWRPPEGSRQTSPPPSAGPTYTDLGSLETSPPQSASPKTSRRYSGANFGSSHYSQGADFVTSSPSDVSSIDYTYTPDRKKRR